MKPKEPITAESILIKHVSITLVPTGGFGVYVTKGEVRINDALAAMEEYAQSYHSQKLEEEVSQLKEKIIKLSEIIKDTAYENARLRGYIASKDKEIEEIRKTLAMINLQSKQLETNK